MEKYIYILLTALGLYSCDLDTNPTDAVSDKVLFEDARGAGYALDGTWAYMMDTYFTYANPGWSTVLLASDAMSSDVVETNSYGYNGHYNFTAFSSSSNYSARSVWTIAYKVIDNMNIIITRIDDVTGDATLKEHIKSQAYALRGYMYLNLATFYSHAYQFDPNAKCAPIYLEPTTLHTEGKSRSTLTDVYKRAEEDLLAALDLGKGFKRSDKHKLDTQVISGLLARLYLQKMDNWDATIKYAKAAQNATDWMGKTEYIIGFNDRTNKEWIWGHGQATDQSTASYSFNYKDVSSTQSFYYSFFADPYFKEFFADGKGGYDASDVRVELFEWDIKRFKGGLMYKKFKYRTDKTADIVLMRKAEMKLIEAEALAEQNNLGDAIKALNELRAARGAATPDLSSKTKSQLVDEIMIERRKELFGEGFGLSDIKRRQNKVDRKSYPANTPVPGYIPEKPENEIFIAGHRITKVDGKDFVPNSELYNIAIPAEEYTNNPNL